MNSITKKIQIQVPDSLIKNKHFKLDHVTFCSYVYLKFLQFRSKSKKELVFNHNEFKKVLYINDNRTLKKVFKKLHEHNLVVELVDKFPSNGLITVKMSDFTDTSFTQLPSTVFYKINDIGYQGIRLLFYYESFINRKEDKDYAYPSVITISKETGISKETVIKYNEILEGLKLLKISKHEIGLDSYDELDKPLFTKYNNHYKIVLKNI